MRERSRGGKKSGERRSTGNSEDRSKIEMVKLKIEKRIRREESRRRMREEEEFHQGGRHTSHHHHLDSHHHRHFTNPDHYPHYDEDEYYGPPGPPFHGEYGPVSPPYPRQHSKPGGGGYCQERPGGFHEKGYLEKGFHAKSFYPPPLPPPMHMHYQRLPSQYY